MDWNSAFFEWKPFRNEVRAQWAQLTCAQLDIVAGVRARLAEQIRASYGVTPDERNARFAALKHATSICVP